jgi:hypothetical protein
LSRIYYQNTPRSLGYAEIGPQSVCNLYHEGAHGEVVLSRTNAPDAGRKGDWIQTQTNKQFFPMDPRVGDIELEDIAHALSHLCRFGGHVDSFYSVAQHSVLVSQHVSPASAVAGLLHDATEAYLVDVPRPIKKHLTNYADIEATLARVIGYRFGVSLDFLPADVQEADERALATEKRDLRGPAPAPWGLAAVPYDDRIVAWTSAQSKKAFLARAFALGIR